METFAYYRPKNIRVLFDLIDQYKSSYRVLAGGTDLLVRLRSNTIAPKAIIDLKGVAELQGEIHRHKDSVYIPALTQVATLESDLTIKGTYPALAEAAHNIGSVQIRNRATIAGNLCNASPAADSAPALLIYNASVICLSLRGERILPLSEFIIGPGKTALAQDELVKAIVLPLPPADQTAVFSRLTRRKGVDLATINLCCQVSKTGATRFALGAVGPVPFIVEDTEGILSSDDIHLEDKKAYLEKMMSKATPISDVRASKEYRLAMLTVLGWRALISAQESISTMPKDNRDQ